MKATSLLTKQHREVKAIFKTLENGHGKTPALLKELADNLAAHMAIEQDIFYPAVKSIDSSLVYESYEEHSLAEFALKRLLACDPKSKSFKAHVTAAKELIEHHVKEEQDELFPKVERKLGAERLNELGGRMKARFDEVKAAGFEASVPKSYAKTSSDLSLRKQKA